MTEVRARRVRQLTSVPHEIKSGADRQPAPAPTGVKPAVEARRVRQLTAVPKELKHAA